MQYVWDMQLFGVKKIIISLGTKRCIKMSSSSNQNKKMYSFDHLRPEPINVTS